MIITLNAPALDTDIKKASGDYPGYVKITIDVVLGKIVIGGEYHFDAEQKLLDEGSKQKNIWGGGLDLTTKELETIAMINVRPQINPHQEIKNEQIKKAFLTIAYKFLDKYANKPAVLP